MRAWTYHKTFVEKPYCVVTSILRLLEGYTRIGKEKSTIKGKQFRLPLFMLGTPEIILLG